MKTDLYTIVISTRTFLSVKLLRFKFPDFNLVFNETGITADDHFFSRPDVINCVGIIAGTETFTDPLLTQLENLRSISRVGVGVDGIPEDILKIKGISLFRTPQAPVDSVAEFTLAQILFLTRLAYPGGVPISIDQKYGIARGIPDLTIGVVGAGNVGGRVIELLENLKPSGLQFYDPHRTEPYISKSMPVIQSRSLEQLLEESDVVTIHTPLTIETQGLLHSRNLNRLKLHSLVINCSREGIVDEHSLLQKLESRHVSGAYLDVWSKGNPFTKSEPDIGLYLSNHQASSTLSARLAMERVAVSNLERGLRSAGLL